MIDLIIGIIMLAVSVFVLASWKLARVIVFETLFHPLRKAVIKIGPAGSIEVHEANEVKPEVEKDSRQGVVV